MWGRDRKNLNELRGANPMVLDIFTDLQKLDDFEIQNPPKKPN